jgi:hypothetical protein
LILKYVPIYTIPDTIGEMISLERLWMGYYPSLVDHWDASKPLIFPESSGNLHNLRVLRLDMMPSVTIPRAMARAGTLETIILYRTRIENLDEFLLCMPAWRMELDLRDEKDLFGPDIYLLGSRTSISANEGNFMVRFPLPEGKQYNVSIKGNVVLEGRDADDLARQPATILAPKYEDIEFESPSYHGMVMPVPWKSGGKISSATFEGNELVIQGR